MHSVCQLLESLSDVPTKEKKNQFDYLKNPQKRQAVLGNYCQILLQVCFKHPSYSPEMLSIRRTLFRHLIAHSNELAEVAPRDLCDVVSALAKLKQCNPSEKWIEKHLRLAAKRSAFCLGKMSLRSKESIKDNFAKVDFYDADLVQMLKKHKLVKGAQDKK